MRKISSLSQFTVASAESRREFDYHGGFRAEKYSACVNEGGDIGASRGAGSSVIPIVPAIKSKVAIPVIA